MISVVIPTVTGREQWLRTTRQRIRATTPWDTLFVTVPDQPTCGIAWNIGIQASLEHEDVTHILLAADDTEPANPDWLQAATYWADKGYLPCARVLNTDGTLQSCGDAVNERPTGEHCRFARIPFASRAQMDAIGPIIETHYFTDVWFSDMGRRHGWPTVVVREFCFYHHYAPQGRLDHRMAPDQAEYERRIRGLP